jgi:hypothetical protein
MKKADDLKLYESALLLALRDEDGTIPAGTSHHFALGGGLVAELLLRGDVASETEKKRDWIVPKHDKKTGDALLDECMELIRASKKKRSAAHWVSKFSGLKNLKHRVAGQLCKKGILRAEEDKVLVIFSRKVYPEVDGGPEKQLAERIRKAVMSDSQAVDPRTVVLIALGRHAGLLKPIFTRAELRERKKRIEQIANGEIVDKAVKEAVAAMHAAIMCAAIIPVICATN